MQNVTFKYTWNSKVDLMWGCQNFNILWKTWNYIFFVYSEIKLEINNKWEFSSVAQFCPTLCDPMDCSTPGLHVHHQLLELTQTHVNEVGDAVQPSHPLLSPSPHGFSLSFRVFSKESVLCIKWPKYWCFQLHHQSSKEYSGLTSFRIDWFDLLTVQVTLKSLLQWHSSKASILWHSAFFFFIVQLSHPYMTTGKTIALTWQTLVGKAIALLFNILSRSVIAFLPRSKKSLLISWLQSPSVVILKPPKIVSHFFHCFCIYLPWSNGIRRSLHGGVFWFFSHTMKLAGS